MIQHLQEVSMLLDHSVFQFMDACKRLLQCLVRKVDSSILNVSLLMCLRFGLVSMNMIALTYGLIG